MRRIALLFFCAGALFARTAELLVYRAILSPANEVPAATVTASGAVTLRVHIVRDDFGQIAEGSVDFDASYAFPAAVTITGMHIHPGAAGTNGPVAISSGISAATAVVDGTGRGTLNFQGQVRSTDQAALDALRGLVANPSQYYANLHTTDFPSGAMRGQLQPADTLVLMGIMSPFNEVPAIGYPATGVSTVTVTATRDTSGALTSAQIGFITNYTFPNQVTFTGYHIHNGPAGVNAGVVLNSGIGAGAASVQSDPSGTGALQRSFEADMSNAAQVQSVNGLFTNPAGYYINLHTTDWPGGIIRAQLHKVDSMFFPVTLLPANEVPPVTGIDTANAPSVVRIHTLRGEDGGVIAGTVGFDVNCRFPAAATMTGMHIHNGAAGGNGPVVIDSGLSAANPVPTDGFGNLYRVVVVSSAAGTSLLSTIVRSPESAYLNVHTTVNPGGAMRSQLAPANSGPPVITGVTAATLDPNAKTFAPGELITLWGTNLAKVATNLDGWQGAAYPDLLNGVAVAVDSKRARVIYVSPTQVNAVLAFDTPLGDQLIAVNNGNTPGDPVPVAITSVAPTLFSSNGSVVAARASDGSLLGPGNAAHAGDMIALAATGLGQTVPALGNGVLAPADNLAMTVPVTVKIGGQNAPVSQSFAAPGYSGLYLIVVALPAGLPAGNQPVSVTVGSATATSFTVPVQ